MQLLAPDARCSALALCSNSRVSLLHRRPSQDLLGPQDGAGGAAGCTDTLGDPLNGAFSWGADKPLDAFLG